MAASLEASQEGLQVRCQHAHNTHVSAHFLCRDCPPEERYLCHICRAEHLEDTRTLPHRVIDLEEYLSDSTKYSLAKDNHCEKHVTERYELICKYCGKFLCVECLGDEQPCPMGSPVGNYHVPVLLTCGIAELKANLSRLTDNEEIITSEAEGLLVKAGDMRTTTQALLTGTISSIEKAMDRLVTKIYEKKNSLRSAAEEYLEPKIEELLDIETDLQMLLENKTNDLKLAKDALTCADPLEVHRTIPELISRLEEKAPWTSLPDVPNIQLFTAGPQEWQTLVDSISLTFSPHGAAASTNPQPSQPAHAVNPPFSTTTNLVNPSPSQTEPARPLSSQSTEPANPPPTQPAANSLPVTYINAPCLPNNGIPTDCITIPSSSFDHAVEVAADNGLWVRNGSGKREREGKGVGWCYTGVCASADGKYCYCIGGKMGAGYIEKYKVKSVGKLKLKKERKVEESRWITGIDVCPTANLLAVVDSMGGRITLHSADDLKTVKVIEGRIGRTQIMDWPNFVAWNPSGDVLYVSEDGSSLVPQSVMCLRLTNPPSIEWRTKMNKPWNIRFARGLVCVPHADDCAVTALSPTDGSAVELITCPGLARGAREDRKGGLVITCYSVE